MIRAFIFILLAGFQLSFAQTLEEVYHIENSKVKLVGTTNVSKYACGLSDLSNNSNVAIKSTREKNTIFLQNALIQLNANEFDCDNKVMTEDLKEAIQSEVYEHIDIKILTIYLNEEINEQVDALQTNVKILLSINLAGVERTYESRLDKLEISMDHMQMVGNLEILMTSFDVSPPTALLGMVKVANKVNINFDITLRLDK